MKERVRLQLAVGLVISLVLFALAGWESRSILGLVFSKVSASEIMSSNVYWFGAALLSAAIGFGFSFLKVKGPYDA